MVGVEPAVDQPAERLGGQLQVGLLPGARPRRARTPSARQAHHEIPHRVGSCGRRRCASGAVGRPREAGDQREVVDDHRGGVVGQDGPGSEHDLDVPGVERVLVEPQADELVEAEASAAPWGRSSAARSASPTASSASSRPRRPPGRRWPSPGATWRSTRPTPTAEVLRRLVAGPASSQPPAHDDGTRAEVRQHVGDRPLPAVGLRLELGVVVGPGRADAGGRPRRRAERGRPWPAGLPAGRLVGGGARRDGWHRSVYLT